MTGSASDAEDLAQDYLKSARVTHEEYVGTWLPEPILTSEDGELPLARSSSGKRRSHWPFYACVESRSPPERAVFILHDVFEYPFGEISTMLEKSPATCRQIFHRARQALQDKRLRFHPEPQRQLQRRQGTGKPQADLRPASGGAFLAECERHPGDPGDPGDLCSSQPRETGVPA